MTLKGNHGYKQKFGTRDYRPLGREELKELVESLRTAPEGTTALVFRKSKAKTIHR
jgi:hypothetical protein